MKTINLQTLRYIYTHNIIHTHIFIQFTRVYTAHTHMYCTHTYTHTSAQKHTHIYNYIHTTDIIQYTLAIWTHKYTHIHCTNINLQMYMYKNNIIYYVIEVIQGHVNDVGEWQESHSTRTLGIVYNHGEELFCCWVHKSFYEGLWP